MKSNTVLLAATCAIVGLFDANVLAADKETEGLKAETIIRNLVEAASKGGNYLLNVGPNSLGEIPAPSIERLKAAGAWIKVNGEAIYGTSATPFGQEFGRTVEGRDGYGGKVQVSSANAWRCTSKPGKLFTHIFEWPAGSFMLTNIDLKITKASLLADPDQKPLKVVADAHFVNIQLPAEVPDKVDSVLVLETDGKPAAAAGERGPNK